MIKYLRRVIIISLFFHFILPVMAEEAHHVLKEKKLAINTAFQKVFGTDLPSPSHLQPLLGGYFFPGIYTFISNTIYKK